MNTRKIKIIISPKDLSYDGFIIGTQGDKATHILDIEFRDLGTITGKKLCINFKRPDNAWILQEVDITDNSSMEIALDDRALEQVGTVIMEFVIKEADDSVILTANKLVQFKVKQTFIGMGGTLIDPDTIVFSLQAAKDELEAYKDSLIGGLDYVSKGANFGSQRGWTEGGDIEEDVVAIMADYLKGDRGKFPADGENAWNYAKGRSTLGNGAYWCDGSKYQSDPLNYALTNLGLPDDGDIYEYGDLSVFKTKDSIKLVYVPHNKSANKYSLAVATWYVGDSGSPNWHYFYKKDLVQNKQGGSTADRPSNPVNYEYYFDATLGCPIWWNGSNWVNATGTTV